jgi:hypothetical protein
MMRNYGIAAVFAGGIFLAPISGAMAQTNVAYAAEPRPEYVVFLDGGSHLSGSAIDTVRLAAGAAKSANQVRLVGRPEHTAAVKNELVREGVPAQSIIVRRGAGNPLPKVADGIDEPVNRRVEISF